MGRPVTYQHADRLGADGAAMLALGRTIWDALTVRQQQTMIDAAVGHARRVLGVEVRLGTARALQSRGLVVWAFHRWLVTPLGMVVREAGAVARGEG